MSAIIVAFVSSLSSAELAWSCSETLVGGVDVRARAADESEPSRALPPTSMFDAAEDELVDPDESLARGILFLCLAIVLDDLVSKCGAGQGTR